MTIRTFSIGGIHPAENKLTNDAVTKVASLPKQAIFPLSQHIGAPAKPVVQRQEVLFLLPFTRLSVVPYIRLTLPLMQQATVSPSSLLM